MSHLAYLLNGLVNLPKMSTKIWNCKAFYLQKIATFIKVLFELISSKRHLPFFVNEKILMKKMRHFWRLFSTLWSRKECFCVYSSNNLLCASIMHLDRKQSPC